MNRDLIPIPVSMTFEDMVYNYEEVQALLDRVIDQQLGFKHGWEVAIDKVLSKIQDLPLSPLQKKLVWKEIKKLK